jgi:AcrR family transcriptional regulator
MVESSVDAVRVEPLAKTLGVTKGSFYWHFKDRGDLLRAVLDKWRRRATLAVVEKLESSNLAPAERVQRLISLPLGGAAAHKAALVEVALRGWARRDRAAHAVVSEVDQIRLRYLIDLLVGAGTPAEEAAARAYLIYSYQLAETLIPLAGRVGTQDPDFRKRCIAILTDASDSR